MTTGFVDGVKPEALCGRPRCTDGIPEVSD